MTLDNRDYIQVAILFILTNKKSYSNSKANEFFIAI